ncbi:hypothetical protein [Flavivirga sp. 57AJ16]|uniref:hypothetical protein n=1 Tax=Flavivirga sp. 57AJ16 TaxID=3025307 RepID=UPI0023667461|nr:hypothetical protein [Flavivirga sp. 57AJ16]MDD7885367.1 hypothetical protein [Flavivirga sp. 57AJ16]
MKALYYYPEQMFIIIVLSIFTINLNAQQNNKGATSSHILLDTIPESSKQPYKTMVSKIVLNEDFNYRKSLKRSVASKRVYVFSNKSLSEDEILKQLKIAARKSDSVSEFISYLNKKEISFINRLDISTLSILYNKIRSTTFNGYLDDLEKAFGSNF